MVKYNIDLQHSHYKLLFTLGYIPPFLSYIYLNQGTGTKSRIPAMIVQKKKEIFSITWFLTVYIFFLFYGQQILEK